MLRRKPKWEGNPNPEAKYRNAPHNILEFLVNDWQLPTIDKSDVEDAMDAVRLATSGAAGRDNPTCLMALPSGRPLPDGNGVWPVDCGKKVLRDNHSVQRNGVLDKIATARMGGTPRQVLHFVPTPSRLADLTRAPGAGPGSRWWWKVERVPPKPVSISLASVGRWACREHEEGEFKRADNLVFPNYQTLQEIDARIPPAKGDQFTEKLFWLAYRTLLFRICQLLGIEVTTTKKREQQARQGNRFAVAVLDARLKDLSSISLDLHRHKQWFDKRIANQQNLGLIHHVAPCTPRVTIAASEYNSIRRFSVRGAREISDGLYASINVIPDGPHSWVVISCIPDAGFHYSRTSVVNAILDFICQNDDIKKRVVFKALSDWFNLYVSPTGYRTLPVEEQAEIERSIAEAVCLEPCRQFLDVLVSSPAGRKEVERADTQLGRPSRRHS